MYLSRTLQLIDTYTETKMLCLNEIKIYIQTT